MIRIRLTTNLTSVENLAPFIEIDIDTLCSIVTKSQFLNINQKSYPYFAKFVYNVTVWSINL